MDIKTEMKKLNFGCGDNIKKEWDNCDIQKSKEIISFDFNKFPYPLKDNVYDYILIESVLFSLNDIIKVLNELWRICKPEGTIEITEAYYNNKGAFTDVSTKHFFSDSTFIELIAQSNTINKINKCKIVEIDLISTIIGKFISCKWLREKLALIFGGLISHVHVKLRVLK